MKDGICFDWEEVERRAKEGSVEGSGRENERMREENEAVGIYALWRVCA